MAIYSFKVWPWEEMHHPLFCKKHALYNQLIGNTLSRNGPDQFNMEHLSRNVFACKVICLFTKD